ncbi:hypothetical protein [Microlunatus aurantiacus]|uniref:hypothetical protein n=1 Tax=Microlunatus aurantiacus TaxID=446786 RepID=UPI0031D97CAD
MTELGEWGGGVFNGGAWLEIDEAKVDLLWRDLDVVDHEISEAQAGRWRQEPLMFHLTGIPTYILLAELAITASCTGTYPGLTTHRRCGRWPVETGHDVQNSPSATRLPRMPHTVERQPASAWSPSEPPSMPMPALLQPAPGSPATRTS